MYNAEIHFTHVQEVVVRGLLKWYYFLQLSKQKSTILIINRIVKENEK